MSFSVYKYVGIIEKKRRKKIINEFEKSLDISALLMFANKHDWHNAKRWSFADPSRRLLKRKTTLTTSKFIHGASTLGLTPHGVILTRLLIKD